MTTYSDFHALFSHRFETAHDVLLHLHQLRQLLSQIRAESAGRLPPESMT